MKKVNIKLLTALLAAALIAGVTIFYACKKEENANNGILKSPPMSEELRVLYGSLPDVDFGNITLLNGEILKFESFEHYEQVYEDLLMLCETWNDLFFATYDSIPENELDSLIRQLGFDEYLPLLKFEELYGIAGNNLRYEVEQNEEMWLNGCAVGTLPFDEIVPCPVEQTLFSKWHEVAIGDTICQMRKGCFEVYIPVSDIQYINIIRNVTKLELLTKAPVQGLPNSVTYYRDPFYDTGGCYEPLGYAKSGTQPHLLDNNYRFYWGFNFRYRNFWKYAETVVTMKNYKLVNGVWEKNRKATCALGSITKLYNGGVDPNYICDEVGPVKLYMNTPNNAFSRTRRIGFGNMIFINSYLRCDANSSEVLCRLYGKDYVINAKTGALKN